MATKKPIPGYPNYFATPMGEIYRFIGGKYRKLKSCMGNKPYLTVNIPDANGLKHRRKVHRLVALTFLSNPQNYPVVCHKDNNPQNNSISNLYWGTQSMNMQQMVSDGRQRKSLISDRFTQAVIEYLSNGLKPKDILKRLPGLSQTSLYRIIRKHNNYG